MPKAMAPKAPWVDVWESPQATVIPGWVSPSSGAITCTMPCRPLPMPLRVIPWSAQLRSKVLSISSAKGSANGRLWEVVGTM